MNWWWRHKKVWLNITWLTQTGKIETWNLFVILFWGLYQSFEVIVGLTL